MSSALIAEQQVSTTTGGDFISGAWRTRTLNTEISDADGIVSISANQFTLGAGTYLIRAYSPAYYCGKTQSRLYNVTDAVVQDVGSCEFHATATAGQSSISLVWSKVTILVDTTFEIQHRCTIDSTTVGLGNATSWGTEQQTTVKIEEVDDSIAIIADQKSLGVSGGTATSGAWRTRDLNTELSDDDVIVSISANKFTLGVGTYLIEAVSPHFHTNQSKSRLYNNTDTSVEAYGISCLPAASGNESAKSSIYAIVTLGDTKELSIEYQVTSSYSTQGLGFAASFGTEQYTMVLIRKIA